MLYMGIEVYYRVVNVYFHERGHDEQELRIEIFNGWRVWLSIFGKFKSGEFSKNKNQ